MMKIKQVSEITGLSERTIRFYESELLIHPASTSINNRRYRDYSQADVDELTTFAGLRRAFFSIQEIREMMQDPSSIPAILEEFQRKNRDEAEARTRIVQTLEGLEPDRIRDVAALASSMRPDTVGIGLPRMDTLPHFGRFDGITLEERENAFQEYLQREGMPRRAYRAKVLKDRAARIVARKGWIAICALGVALVVVSVALSSVSARNAEYRRQESQRVLYRWYELHDMFRRMEQIDLEDSEADFGWMHGYVNTTCHAMTLGGLPTGLDSMDGLRILEAYDQLFLDLLTVPTYYREEGVAIMKEMNGELLRISEPFVGRDAEEMEKLLAPETPEGQALRAEIQTLSTKYGKLLDKYWSHDGVERS
jgi:DNA-binding transcriptional MerR regulator